MTAARLSPSATLLKNSKLFALPPAIPVPPARPSSEPVASSDTATTPWPVRAAIETPILSRNKGDWGMKRPLPLKTTTKSGTPVIRIRRGIDTAEHIADFESSADHVLTLGKWQTLNLPMTIPRPQGKGNDDRQDHVGSVFSAHVDNTYDISAPRVENDKPTGIWPNIDQSDLDFHLPASLRESNRKAREARAASRRLDSTPPAAKLASQKKQQYRWRYEGPWLAGMTGMEFDAYLEKVVSGRRKEFREKIKTKMIQENEEKRRETALAEGMHEAGSSSGAHPSHSLTENDIADYIKGLRSNPGKFGRLITEFLDLPEGPRDGSTPAPWENGRRTAASMLYPDNGPPSSHPSAGLSYTRTRTFSDNDAIFGPQDTHVAATGRVLKTKRAGQGETSTIGLAGFVISGSTARGDIRGRENVKDRKVALVAQRASLNSKGGVEIFADNSIYFQVAKDNMPIRNDLAVAAVPKPPQAAIDARNSPLPSKRPERVPRSRLTQTQYDVAKMQEESTAQQGSETQQLLSTMTEIYRPRIS